MIFFDCCFSWRLTSWPQDLLCHGGVQFLVGKKIPDFLPPKFRPPYRGVVRRAGLCSLRRSEFRVAKNMVLFSRSLKCCNPVCKPGFRPTGGASYEKCMLEPPEFIIFRFANSFPRNCTKKKTLPPQATRRWADLAVHKTSEGRCQPSPFREIFRFPNFHTKKTFFFDPKIEVILDTISALFGTRFFNLLGDFFFNLLGDFFSTFRATFFRLLG